MKISQFTGDMKNTKINPILQASEFFFPLFLNLPNMKNMKINPIETNYVRKQKILKRKKDDIELFYKGFSSEFNIPYPEVEEYVQMNLENFRTLSVVLEDETVENFVERIEEIRKLEQELKVLNPIYVKLPE